MVMVVEYDNERTKKNKLATAIYGAGRRKSPIDYTQTKLLLLPNVIDFFALLGRSHQKKSILLLSV
jgi:hypothetical protein